MNVQAVVTGELGTNYEATYQRRVKGRSAGWYAYAIDVSLLDQVTPRAYYLGRNKKEAMSWKRKK